MKMLYCHDVTQLPWRIFFPVPHLFSDMAYFPCKIFSLFSTDVVLLHKAATSAHFVVYLLITMNVTCKCLFIRFFSNITWMQMSLPFLRLNADVSTLPHVTLFLFSLECHLFEELNHSSSIEFSWLWKELSSLPHLQIQRNTIASTVWRWWEYITVLWMSNT